MTVFDPGKAIAGLKQLEQSRAKSATGGAGADLAREVMRPMIQDGYLRAAGVRLALAVESDAPFPERLVHFWSNHFAVSVDKVPVIGLAGRYEFEAIRPIVMGRFEDLLLVEIRHPAMLLYLDQAQSVGPGSQLAQAVQHFGRGRTVGLNENLAREALELHTLGVDGGYGQAGVAALAGALAGHFGLYPDQAARAMFGLGVRPATGLVFA